MTPPKLSIALTTYNHGDFIIQALDSIIAQKPGFDYEIVIGEDHSTDDTRKLILEYEKKVPGLIRLLPSSGNKGYVRNFDETLKACTGEYIAVFDGDDIMLPGKLQKQVEFLDTHPDHVMVGHEVRAFDSESGKTLRTIKPYSKKEFYTIEDLIIYGSFFANCSKVFRRSHLPAEGIDQRISAIADWYITMMIVDKSKIGYIHELLAEYRVHGASIMQKLKGKQDFEDKMFILEKLNKRYGRKYERLFKNQLAYAYLIYGIDELNNGNIPSARKKFVKSIFEKFNYTGSQYFYLLSTLLPGPLRNSLLQLRKMKK